MEIPRLCSHRTQSHPAVSLGKASHYITRQITLRVRRSFALGQRLQTSRCYSWESLGDKEKAVVISSFSKNLQFCRFSFETESEAPGPLFSLEYLPRSVITRDVHSTHEILHSSSLPFFIFGVLRLPVCGHYTLG